jgi:predicted transposase/invertase (TIGR01784 family)
MVEYLENLQMSEEDREMHKSIFERVYSERGRQEGLQEGLQEGIQEGLQRGKLEMAKNLLARGVSPDIIADSSGLSQSDIQSLTE